MIKEFPNNMWKHRAADYLIKKIDLDSTTARKPGSGRPKSARTRRQGFAIFCVFFSYLSYCLFLSIVLASPIVQ